MADPYRFQALDTLTVAKDTASASYSTAQLDIVRYRNGDIRFTVGGVVKTFSATNEALRDLFDAMDALV